MLQVEPENKTLIICHSTNVPQEIKKIYLVPNSSSIIYLERSLAPAARGRAGLIINFKERQHLKEKPKPDGKGAGKELHTPLPSNGRLLLNFPKAKPLKL